MSEKRKAGDTLILSGTMHGETGGNVFPVDADWGGAVGKINISTDEKVPVLVVDHGSVTLTPPAGATLATYRYQGAPGLVDEGKYLYEIEITFANGVILTWPNDKAKMKLEVVAELG